DTRSQAIENRLFYQVRCGPHGQSFWRLQNAASGFAASDAHGGIGYSPSLFERTSLRDSRMLNDATRMIAPVTIPRSATLKTPVRKAPTRSKIKSVTSP